MKKVLVVIDMQNDFITGSLGSKDAVDIVPNVKAKIQEYAEHEDVIIFTRDTHDENYLNTQEGKKLPVGHCIKDTWGWEIARELYPNVGQFYTINKPTFGYMAWKEFFDKYALPMQEIEIVGLVTDICVISNALILKATFPWANISIDAGCTAGLTPEKKDAALSVAESCQIDVANR